MTEFYRSKAYVIHDSEYNLPWLVEVRFYSSNNRITFRFVTDHCSTRQAAKEVAERWNEGKR